MSRIIYKDRTKANSRKFSGLKDKFGRDDLIPLWIADMDFEVPKCVTDGLREYIDFEDFENKIIENDVKLFILCNPHNPVGRVWTEWTID